MGSRSIGRFGALVIAAGSLLASSSCASDGDTPIDGDVGASEEELRWLHDDHGFWRGPGHHHGHKSKRAECSAKRDGDEIVLKFSSGRHRPLRLTSTHREARGSTSTSTVTVYLGDRQLWRLLAERQADGSFTLTIDYSRPLRGVRHVVISSSDGATATAVVDGRATLPFQMSPAPAVAFFPNGQRAPDVVIPKGLSQAIEHLLRDAKRDAAECFSARIDDLGGSNESTPLSALASTPDFGHFSNPEEFDHCWLCRGFCAATFTECVMLAVGVGSLCGPFAWACIPAGIALCTAGVLACVDLCDADGESVCCPTLCREQPVRSCCHAHGDGSGVGQETCLNSQIGLCCGFEKTPCGGVQCCALGEECLPDADPGQKCCSPGQGCGSVCCPDVLACVDPAQGLCCLPDLVCNGTCCGFDEMCENGQCVPADPPELPTPLDCAQRGEAQLGEDGLGIPCQSDAACPCQSPAPGDDPVCGLCTSSCCLNPPR
jgi:hypothetical protein